MHVALDIGNVLVDVNLSIFVDSLNYHLENISGPVSYKHSLDFLNELQPLQDLGLNSVKTHLANIYPELNSAIIYSLQKDWDNTIRVNQQMVNFIEKLKFAGVKIALLSNIGFEHKERLRQIWPALFEGTIQHFSCDVGARKPQKLYFQSFLEDYNEFKAALYLDDREENLIVGKKYGFETLHFKLDDFNKKTLSEQKKELDIIYNFLTTLRN